MQKLIITDPCYIIKNEDWDKACKECTNEDSFCEDFLSKLRTIFKAEGIKGTVEETGYGDWTNNVHSASEKVEISQSEFGADSGLVCVVQESPLVLKRLGDVPSYCYARVVFNVEDPILVTYNRDNPDWTVVLFHDKNNLLLAKTSEANEEF